MILALIAGASENNVIGKGGALPWKLPAELQYFRDTTMGKTVIMGRKTYESIGRPLPKRRNIIVSRTAQKIEGCEVATSLEEAIEMANFSTPVDQEVFVIGGETLYREALPLAGRVYLTRVHTVIEDGDVFFPEIDPQVWEVVKETHRPADADNPISCTFLLYERKK